jgi:hypothetical protein
MGIFVTFVVGLVLWIILWAIGAKSLDAILLTIMLLVVAVAAHIMWPMLPGNRRPADPTDNPPYN